MEVLSIGGWLALVLAGIGMMQWGSQRVCAMLGELRRHWGLAETAGGTMIGLATASPEISVNVASVAFGWPDIGLGTALGSNVPALPLIFAIAYVSTRWHRRDAVREHVEQVTGCGDTPDPAPEAPSPVPRVKPLAAQVQVLPYLLVVGLLAALTLPAPWAGLHPADAVILSVTYGLYLAQAVLKGRNPAAAAGSGFPRRQALRALPGLLAIAGGAVASVLASRQINQALGISDLVGGLFITGLLCALPESFSAWRLSRTGRATSAVSGAVADGIVSLTLALVPLAIIGTSIGDVALYVVNLCFLGFVLIAYMLINHERRGGVLTLKRVLIFDAGYLVYLAAALWIIL